MARGESTATAPKRMSLDEFMGGGAPAGLDDLANGEQTAAPSLESLSQSPARQGAGLVQDHPDSFAEADRLRNSGYDQSLAPKFAPPAPGAAVPNAYETAIHNDYADHNQVKASDDLLEYGK